MCEAPHPKQRERRKLVLIEKANQTAPSQAAFDGLFEHALSFLKNPLTLWNLDIF